MKKVAFCNAEYNASLPPYRFESGDVVEIDDDWADALVRKGIATPAPANAKTVQQIRIESRPPRPTAADERAARRAALLAEIEQLDREGGYAPAPPDDGGHFSDMVTRGDAAMPEEEEKPKAHAGGKK